MFDCHVQELPNMHDGESKLYPKFTPYNQFDNKKMIKRIAMEAGVHDETVDLY